MRSERIRSPYEAIVDLLYWADYVKLEDMKRKIAEKEVQSENQTQAKKLKKGYGYKGPI